MPFIGLLQTPFLEQEQTPLIDQQQSPFLIQDYIYENPCPQPSPQKESPLQVPFLDQVPYRTRIGKGEFLFPPMSYNLFTNPAFAEGGNEGADKDFFRVFAAAKEPFGSTELPLGEFVDSSTPIFEIKDVLSGSQIRKQNRFGGLQNPLRAPKNIIDEDEFVGLFGFSQKKRRKTKEKSIFDIF